MCFVFAFLQINLLTFVKKNSMQEIKDKSASKRLIMFANLDTKTKTIVFSNSDQILKKTVDFFLPWQKNIMIADVVKDGDVYHIRNPRNASKFPVLEINGLKSGAYIVQSFKTVVERKKAIEAIKEGRFEINE
jgi:hypothetical protein